VERAETRAPLSMKVLSGLVCSHFPMKGLESSEETLKTPIRIPISNSVIFSLDRWMGRVGMREKKAAMKANWAKKARTKSRVNIFDVNIACYRSIL